MDMSHVHDQVGMMMIAVDFYKNLFAKESRPNISLAEDFWLDSDKVSQDENDYICAPFSKEIKEAAFSCYSEGAPDPNGLTFLFFSRSSGILLKLT